MIGEDRLASTIRRMSSLHRRSMGTRFEQHGISRGQPKILGFLSENNGCIQKELALHCHVEPATVTKLLENMERDGLIERKTSTEDRRVLRVYITEKGHALHEQAHRIAAEVTQICLAGFTAEQTETVITLMNKLADNLDERLEISHG